MRSAFWKIRSGLQSLILHEEGQDMVEYALLLLLAVIALVVSVGSFATALIGLYTYFNANFP